MMIANANQNIAFQRESANDTAIIDARESTVVSESLWSLLAERSQEQRWIFWIGPPEFPTLKKFTEHGIDPRRVLVVHLSPSADPLEIAKQALQAGTCSAVLAWSDAIDTTTLTDIQQAASDRDAVAILLHPQTQLSLAA